MPKTKPAERRITKGEALELLQSAVSYLQAAGWEVQCGNSPYLTLVIDGAILASDPARFAVAAGLSAPRNADDYIGHAPRSRL